MISLGTYDTAVSPADLAAYRARVKKLTGIVFDPRSFAHVQRWQAAKLRTDWAETSGARPSADHAKWIALLNGVKTRSLADPGTLLTEADALGDLVIAEGTLGLLQQMRTA